MPEAAPVDVPNSLLKALPRRGGERLLARCETISLVFGDILCEPDEPVRHVYFPSSGCISLVAGVTGHPPLEMGLIGSEGMLGATLMLGVDTAPLRGVVQGTGNAARMTAGRFRRELLASPALLRILNRYLYVLLAQLAQSAACTRFHEVGPRLARWLLLTHDRVHADRFHLTHEFLADMLGVRRSAVSIAASQLQRRKIIGYSRGDIRILDRAGLEAAACECYAAVVADYGRLLRP